MNSANLLSCIAEAALYVYFSGLLIEVEGRKKKLFCFLTVFLLSALLYVLGTRWIYFGLYSFWISAILFGMMYLCQSRETSMPAENLMVYCFLLNCMISIAQEIVFLGFIAFCNMNPVEVILSKWNLVSFALSRAIVTVFLYLMTRYTRKYIYLKSDYSVVFVCIFGLLYVITTLMESRLFRPDTYKVFVCCINILMFFIIVFTYLVFCKSSYDSFMEKQNASLALQLRHVETNTRYYLQKEKEIRRIRHDLKNQFTILDGYLERNDIESCRQIIRESLSTIDHTQVYFDTGSVAVDAILRAKFTRAQNEGIDTFSSVQLPVLSRSMEYDIALILGNLLDNAIENISEKERRIRLHIRTDDRIVIRMENTTDREDMETKTSKKDSSSHGIGLNSVRTVAALHEGALLTDLANGIFTAIVTLEAENSDGSSVG